MSKKLSFQFDGIAFKQNPKAPELFSFVAPAEDLTKLCGVARKSESMLTNYQRALDTARVEKEVTPFFERPENCSPTAIVLSIHDSPTTTVKFEDLSGSSGAIKFKRMSIEMDDFDAMSDDEIMATAVKFLDARLATSCSRMHDDQRCP